MSWNLLFFVNSILLGVGLAMDAFSVSLANGLAEPGMRRRKMCGIAGVFGFFQFAMPMIGWICVHTIVGYFQAFEKFIPWIVLALLGYIGGKMLYENIRFGEEQTESAEKTGLATLLLQGVATSIDALSVGFAIADYEWKMALVCSILVAVTTFAVCLCGVCLGKKFGTRLAGKAGILGGTILIVIGLEIFITGII